MSTAGNVQDAAKEFPPDVLNGRLARGNSTGIDIHQVVPSTLGMTHSVLVPSLMAWELGIYEKLGYRKCNTIALMIREQS